MSVIGLNSQRSATRKPQRVEAGNAPLVINLTVDYTGVADPRINVRNFCAHVWTDAARMHQLDEGYESPDTQFWETINLEHSTSGTAVLRGCVELATEVDQMERLAP